MKIDALLKEELCRSVVIFGISLIVTAFIITTDYLPLPAFWLLLLPLAIAAAVFCVMVWYRRKKSLIDPAITNVLHRTRILAYSGTFVALIAAGSWISIPLPLVPLTLQTLFVLLSGIVMKRYGVIPVALYVLLGAAGLPFNHNGTAGLGVLLGPTGGYLIGFILAALAVGLAYEHKSPKYRLAGLITGTCLILFFGAAWIAYSASLSLSQAFLVGVAPFVFGDAVKAAAAYAIGKRVA